MKINSRFSNDEMINEIVSPYEDFYTNNNEMKNEMVNTYEESRLTMHAVVVAILVESSTPK
jgi:hypothetical protein